MRFKELFEAENARAKRRLEIGDANTRDVKGSKSAEKHPMHQTTIEHGFKHSASEKEVQGKYVTLAHTYRHPSGQKLVLSTYKDGNNVNHEFQHYSRNGYETTRYGDSALGSSKEVQNKKLAAHLETHKKV